MTSVLRKGKKKTNEERMGPRRRKGRKRPLARRVNAKNKSNDDQIQDKGSWLHSVMSHHPYSSSNRDYLPENESLMWFCGEKGPNVDAEYVEDGMPLDNRMTESYENPLWLSPRQRRGGHSDACIDNRTAGQKQQPHSRSSITSRMYWGAGSGGGSKSNEFSLNFEYMEDLSPWVVARLLPPDLLSPSPMQRKDLFWPRNANEVSQND